MCYNNNINIHYEAPWLSSNVTVFCGTYLLLGSFYGLCSFFSNEQQTNFFVTEEVDLKSAPLFFFLSGLKYTHSRLKDQFVCGGESVSVTFALQPLNFLVILIDKSCSLFFPSGLR